MPISVDHEFTFGGIPCLVTTTSGSRPTAWMYAIVAGGQALRPLVDEAGQRIEVVVATGDDPLEGALSYLEQRFGPRGAAQRWLHARSQSHVWTVRHDNPVRPDDDLRGLPQER